MLYQLSPKRIQEIKKRDGEKKGSKKGGKGLTKAVASSFNLFIEVYIHTVKCTNLKCTTQ